MFDYSADAELFPARSGQQFRRKIGYRRFSHASEAIRFAMEAMPPDLLNGAFLEVNEERFNADQIRQLYEDLDYPLPRHAEG